MADHSPTDRPPLWKAMRAAESSCASDLFSPEARIIRVVRDWLGLEEPEPQPGHRYEQRHIIWRHNQRLRALLTAEIDRAERGEGSNA